MDESSMYQDDSYLMDDSVAINNLSPRRCSPSRAELLAAANVPLTNQDGSAGTSHTARILTGVHLLQKKNALCDVTLIAEGCRFSAHKAILAASSPYFWNLFVESPDANCTIDYNKTPAVTAEMRNSNSNEVMISDVTSRALLGVISFVYSSSVTNMKMTVSTIAEILLAAIKMQVMGLPQYCIDHLRVNIDFENCIDVFVCGQKQDLESMIDTAIQFMTESFGTVTQTVSFLELTIDQLKALLKNSQLKENLGGNLAIAVERWVEHDSLARDLHNDGLMRLVPATPRTPLRDVTKNRVNGKSIENLHKTIALPKYSQGAVLTPKIIAMGGEDIQGVLSERSYVFDPKTGQWDLFATMPIRRLDLCAVTHDNHMYVVGGQHSADSKATDSIGTIHRYNPRFDSWEQLHPMQKRRALFTLDAVNDCLYAVGGKNTQGSLASVECFDPDKNAWDYVSHLPLPVFGHAGAVHDGKLYVTGGVVSGRSFSCALQCYDPIIDKWSYYPPMTSKRAFHVMRQVGDKLYVIGGNSYNENGKRVDCSKVECYDLDTNQWQTLTPMLQPVCFAAVAAYKQYIYVIGGYNGRKSKRHADVQRYNTREDEWSVASQLPEPMMRLGACKLNLPASATGPVMKVTRLNTHGSEGSQAGSG
ncbi:kelch-like protein 26 [Amphiura filiformis]|uniref:kelch-like protein 26 n=1 Tax=Amphiura filiformis TaxID=82378 RepID=UPI003B22522A